jgi:hypothetical protein
MEQQAIIDYFHKTIGTFRNGSSPPIFPGPQPVSIERKHFQTLKNGTYVVCEKSDGVRHSLICTTFKGKKICALINRTLSVTFVNLNFPKSACNGTILDGELINGNEFLVYDGMSTSGTNIMNLNLIERLDKIGIFIKGIMKTRKDFLKIKLKKFFVTPDTSELIHNYIPKLSYKTDGLVFTPIFEKVKLGTHETMFKWKPKDMNTIDFQVKDRGEKWGLYIQERGVLIFQSELPKTYESEFLKSDAIVECQYMIEDKIPWWKPVGLRTDKNYPNNRRTFYRTLVNIREDIQEDEFIKMFI